jgi:putative transposase
VIRVALRQKAFKVQLEPTSSQKVQIDRTIGCARFVYNRFLARRKEMYLSEQKTLSYNACSAELTVLKKEIEWLAEVDKFALQGALKDLDTAYQNFFRDCKRTGPRGAVLSKTKPAKQRHFKAPLFKKKHGSKQSYRTNLTNGNIQIAENQLKLPKLKWIKFRKSQEIQGRILNVTVSRSSTGKYFASILCEVDILPLPTSSEVVGIDLGLKDFFTSSGPPREVAQLGQDSDGEVVANPRPYRTLERKLRKASQDLSRKLPGSNNRSKAKTKLAKIHARIANTREDFLHKTSTALIRENGLICLETLRPKAMVKNRRLAKSISDASWGRFVLMLEYKALWYGRTVVKIDPFFPSSQLCSTCGTKNSVTKDLSVREWTCTNCETEHHRDFNAALNIRTEGLRIVAHGIGDTLNACGDGVKPELNLVAVSEAGIMGLKTP